STGFRTRWWRRSARRSRKWPTRTSSCTSSTRPPATGSGQWRARGRVPAVRAVLDEVGASDVPLIEVYNKIDALTPDEQRRLQEQDPDAVFISALQRQGIDELGETATSRL